MRVEGLAQRGPRPRSRRRRRLPRRRCQAPRPRPLLKLRADEHRHAGLCRQGHLPRRPARRAAARRAAACCLHLRRCPARRRPPPLRRPTCSKLCFLVQLVEHGSFKMRSGARTGERRALVPSLWARRRSQVAPACARACTAMADGAGETDNRGVKFAPGPSGTGSQLVRARGGGVCLPSPAAISTRLTRAIPASAGR